MANVLKPEKQDEIRALGRLGWSLRRIEEAVGVRRETISGYLKAAGIPVRGEGPRFLEGWRPPCVTNGLVSVGPSEGAGPRMAACPAGPPGIQPDLGSSKEGRQWPEQLQLSLRPGEGGG
jgi:hypothetical protein